MVPRFFSHTLYGFLYSGVVLLGVLVGYRKLGSAPIHLLRVVVIVVAEGDQAAHGIGRGQPHHAHQHNLVLVRLHNVPFPVLD